MALEWSLVWQWWKRSSFRPLAKAYLLDDILPCHFSCSCTRSVMLLEHFPRLCPDAPAHEWKSSFGGSTGTSAQAPPGLPHVRGRQLSDLTPLPYYRRHHTLQSTPLRPPHIRHSPNGNPNHAPWPPRLPPAPAPPPTHPLYPAPHRPNRRGHYRSPSGTGKRSDQVLQLTNWTQDSALLGADHEGMEVPPLVIHPTPRGYEYWGIRVERR